MRKALTPALLTIVLSFLAWSCQKEVSKENNGTTGGDGSNNTPGWSFTGAASAAYKGCVDTAYYETVSGFNTLTIEGTDSADNYFMINLVAQGALQPGTYTNAQGAIMSVVTSTGSFMSMSPNSFSITITTINDTLLAAGFSGTLSDAFSNETFAVSNGKITALIGRANPCSSTPPDPGTPGGGNNGSSAVFSLESSMGDCSNAKIEGSYLRDTVLTSANKVTLEVAVSTAGPWTLSTSTVNGIKFSGSGTFASTGMQTITLQGSGKPVAYGDTQFPVSTATSQCSFSVLVDTPHIAPCSPANNTIEFSLGGVGPISLYGTTTTASGGSYKIVGNGTGGDITMEFAGLSQPKAGLYKIENWGGSFLPGSVRVSLVASNIYWQSSSGDLYVSIKAGKVVATFCNVSFSGSLGGPSYTTKASGMVTEE